MNDRKASLKQLTQRTKKKYWERVRKNVLYGDPKNKNKKQIEQPESRKREGKGEINYLKEIITEKIS